MVLHAECSNCVSWRATAPEGARPTLASGQCAKQLTPPAGEPLCEKYEADARFTQALISALLKDEGPMVIPVKLPRKPGTN